LDFGYAGFVADFDAELLEAFFSVDGLFVGEVFEDVG
jgi:hypothetical protein